MRPVSRRRHPAVLPAVLAAASGIVVFALVGCATPGAGTSGADPAGTSTPAPPAGEVIAQGTVMDVGGDVELCLGAIAESYPPQCSGIPLEGWSWEGVDGYETAGDVTWGAYAVQGTYDGERFASTAPPMLLALYDPIAPEDPTGGEPGAGTEDELLTIQEELPELLGDGYLSSFPDDGWLRVQVVWDDGTWQSAADERWGPDRVVVFSALRPVAG